MKRLITNDTKQNKKQKLSDLKDCKIDTIVIKHAIYVKTPCGKFLIGTEGFSIFRYCLETKQKFRIAGSVDQPGYQDGTRDESRFYSPTSLIFSKNGKTLFVSDRCNYVIRAICVQTGITTTFAGKVGVQQYVDGPKEKACFYRPDYLKLSPDGNTLIVVDYLKIRSICITTGQVNTIVTFEHNTSEFIFSSDSKHIYILNLNRIFKYNLETCKSYLFKDDSFFKDKPSYFGGVISKDGQLLFISNYINNYIQIFNLATNEVINTIPITFKPEHIFILKNDQLCICNRFDNKTQFLDISEYCTNFKTFTQSKLSKYSFLPRQVIKRFN
jgi:DNA-binding beta-propeller fold protein YncE